MSKSDTPKETCETCYGLGRVDAVYAPCPDCELTAARAEIDKWEQIACDKLSEVCRHIEKTRIVTEQRDRLAEALQECREDSVELLGERDWWQNEPRCDYQKRYQETRDNVTRADEALQSLTTNEQ